MDDLPDNTLKLRYLAGECSPAERARVEQWLAAEPERQAELDGLADTWRALAQLRPEPDWQPAFSKLADRLGIGSTLPQPCERLAPEVERGHRVPRRTGGAWSVWLQQRSAPFAAGLLVAAGVVALIAFGTPVVRTLGAREYVTAPGQRETVSLSDGTLLTLAPGSRVRLGVNYGRRRRDVYLREGEAYFTVVHDPQHPFAVHSRNAVAEDIGTRFGVRSYSDEDAVQVVVADGVVSLADSGTRQGHGVILTSATRGVMRGDGHTTVSAGVDVERYTGWTAGRLVFRATPLREVVRDLGRWYDLDIRLSDASLGALPFTATYTTESPDQVLSLVSAAAGVRYERHDRVVTIGR